MAHGRKEAAGISIKHENETYSFSSSEIDEIVEARLEEIFEAVHKELKKAGRAGQLPSGVVLTGGSAQLKGITEYAKEKLGLAARTGKSSGFGGVAENIEEPQFASVIGLMLLDAGQGGGALPKAQKKPGVSGKDTLKQASGVISKFLGKFKA